jgi:hypothetical protein
MKTYWGSAGIAPRNLDLGTRWRWVVSFTPRPLYPQGNNIPYPLDKRLGGPQSRSGCGDEQKKTSPRRVSNPDRPIVQPVASRCTDRAITDLGRSQFVTFSGVDPEKGNFKRCAALQIRIVTQCSVVIRYQSFGDSCCLHLQGEVIGEGQCLCIYFWNADILPQHFTTSQPRWSRLEETWLFYTELF